MKKVVLIVFIFMPIVLRSFSADLTLEFNKKMFSMGIVMDAIPIELGFLLGKNSSITMGLKGTEYLEEKIGFFKLSYGKLDYLLKLGLGEFLHYRFDLYAKMVTPPVFYDIQASFRNEDSVKYPVVFGNATVFGKGKKLRGFSRLFLNLNTREESFNLKLNTGLSGSSMSFFPGFFLISNNRLTGAGLMFNPIPVDSYGMNGLSLKAGTDFFGSPYMGFEWMSKLLIKKAALEFNTEVGITENSSIADVSLGLNSENLNVNLGIGTEGITMNISINTSF